MFICRCLDENCKWGNKGTDFNQAKVLVSEHQGKMVSHVPSDPDYHPCVIYHREFHSLYFYADDGLHFAGQYGTHKIL